MTRRLEAALEAWRSAARRLEHGRGDTDELQRDVDDARREFQRVSAEDVTERINALKDAEERRQASTPSTDPYHRAAAEETKLAREIFESARVADQEIPDRSRLGSTSSASNEGGG
jgi:hypothetical protein